MNTTFWHRVSDLLIEPSDAITDEETRTKVRILGTMLFILIPLAIVGSIFGYEPLWLSVIFMVLSYLFSRTKYFYLAGFLTLISLIVPSYAAVINARQSDYWAIGFAFSWTLIPHMLTAVLLSPVGAIILATANLVGVMLLTLLTPEFSFADTGAALGLIGSTNVLVVLTIVLRNHYLNKRIRAETRLRQSLEEKEVLLKEIHHRVKNNLQIISSLLNLQVSRAGKTQDVTPLLESQRRVKAMALVHETLYQSVDLARVNFAHYLRSLLDDLSSSLTHANISTQLDLPTDDLMLEVDKALPCGLIISELVSNAVEHAFSATTAGEIRVTLVNTKRQVMLSVTDNGAGLPADFDVASTDTLGFRLVQILTSQLEGTITVDTTSGTTFTLSFGLP